MPSVFRLYFCEGVEEEDEEDGEDEGFWLETLVFDPPRDEKEEEEEDEGDEADRKYSNLNC